MRRHWAPEEAEFGFMVRSAREAGWDGGAQLALHLAGMAAVTLQRASLLSGCFPCARGAHCPGCCCMPPFPASQPAGDVGKGTPQEANQDLDLLK